MSCEYQTWFLFFFKGSVFYWLCLLFFVLFFSKQTFGFSEFFFLKSNKLFLNLVTAASHKMFGSMTLIERFFNECCRTEAIKIASQNKIRYHKNIKNSKTNKQTVVICDCFSYALLRQEISPSFLSQKCKANAILAPF